MSSWLQLMNGEKHQLDSDPSPVPCFRCGQCCTDYLVKLDGPDLKLLLSGLNISRRELFIRFVRETPIGPVLRQNGRECVFLQKHNGMMAGCSVYRLRPGVCRNYAPGLTRAECLKGLALAGKTKKVLLPGDLFLKLTTQRDSPPYLQSRNMLYVLAGPDDFSLSQYLQEIQRGLGDPGSLETNTSVLDGQRFSLDELRHAVETVPFLSDSRLVIVYGLIDRFDSPPRSERGRHSKNAQVEAGPFISCLLSIPETTTAVLIEAEFPDFAKGKFKELPSKARVKLFPVLKEAALRPWVQDRVSRSGSTISPTAVALLFRLAGSNLWVLANELDKLATFALGRRIEEEDVRQLVGYTQDISVFSLIDAVLDFRGDAASQMLQQLLHQGAAPAFLLFMLDRQYRLIVQAKGMNSQGIPENSIQAKLGLFNDYAFRRTMEQAAKYTMDRLRSVYSRLLDADLAMKTGTFEGDLALELLVAELCSRAT